MNKKHQFQEEFEYLLEDEGYVVLAKTDTSIHVQEIATNAHMLAEINDFITDAFTQQFPYKGVCYSEWETKHQSGGIDVHRLHIEIEGMMHEISVDVKESRSLYQLLVAVYVNMNVSHRKIDAKDLSPAGRKEISKILRWMIDKIMEHPHYRLPFVTSVVDIHYTDLAKELMKG